MLLRASVYKDRGGDCSNGGLSSKYDEVLVSTEPETDDLETPRSVPIVKVVRRQLFGEEYIHVEPVEPVKSGYNGYMAGGCFVYSCDSRFREACKYPVSLHDRTEEVR